MAATQAGIESESARILRELEHSNKMLTTFIDSSEAGMYVTDYHTGEILYANRKMLTLFGVSYDVSQIIGHTCWKLLNDANDGRCSFCPYIGLLAGDGSPREPYAWEHFFEARSLWLKISSQAVVWVDGRMAQMNTFYDITKTKHMQEQLSELAREKEYRRMQATLQTILDVLPVPVIIMSMQAGEIQYINRSAAGLFGVVSPADALGKLAADFVLEQPLDISSLAEKVTGSGAIPSSGEYSCRKTDGTPVEVRFTSCTIDYNGERAFLSIIQDLTAEKEQQRMLTNAAEREREANALKSRFLSDMSHEIRTPMNAIIGLTDIAIYKRPPDDVLEVYQKVNRSAKNLLQIINDILDLSKIEADKMELHPEEFDLDEILNNVSMVVVPRLEGKNIEFMLNVSLDISRYIVGDKTRLWQILKNHLDNAAKYTERGSIVMTVEEDKAQSTEDTVCIVFTVDDTGIGMDEDDLRRAALPFEQIYNDMQVKYTGSGLGMSISKRLCNLMGGRLDIESKSGKGTLVRIAIPFQRSRFSENGRETYEKNALSGLRILVADDNNLSLEIISRLLQKGGAEYVLARSGEEALSLISACRTAGHGFDVVLLDYIMDGMNGLDTAREIRALAGQKPKLMIITAFKHSFKKEDLLSCGIDCLVEKPFVPSQFLELILKTVGREYSVPEVPVYAYTGFRNARVLVCEDNELNREVASKLLGQFGVDVVLAENGARGVEVMESDSAFDCILMDLHMPIMDGYQAARLIRSRPAYDGIPIISLSADAMTEVSGRCLEIGMNDFLPKPINITDMHKILLKWLPESKRLSSPA